MEKPVARARPARRHADPDQGPRERRGRALDAGLADLRRPHPGEIRHPGGTSRGRRWHRLRDVEHAGIRRRRQHLQRGVRRDAQSVEHRRARRRARRAAPPWRSQPAWPGSRTAPTWAARLRNPASFNGIVGFRPSIGRVAHTPNGTIDMNLGQQGPMARNVEDVRVAARRDERRGPARSFLAAAHGQVVIWRRRARHGGRSASPGRRDLGITRVGRRGRGDHPQGGRALRRARRDRRGGASGLLRPARRVSSRCALRLLHAQGGAAARASRAAQARGDLEYRERP